MLCFPSVEARYVRLYSSAGFECCREGCQASTQACKEACSCMSSRVGNASDVHSMGIFVLPASMQFADCIVEVQCKRGCAGESVCIIVKLIALESVDVEVMKTESGNEWSLVQDAHPCRVHLQRGFNTCSGIADTNT